ncbi:hypothetical protein EFN35_05965 [Pediococcus parvulus]|nr:hypothetical protein [Pediococcus parvulus]MCT3030257.1 hypothetical protein [Pediococcus parvulus]
MRDRNPAGVLLIFYLLTCRAVLELSGKNQYKRRMRDRNPAGVMLILSFLFCRAVLELTEILT